MTQAKSKIKAVEEATRQKIETARDVVAEKAALTAEQLDEVKRNTAEAVRARYEDAMADLHKRYEQLSYDMDDVRRSVDRGVRRHPYETAGAAVAAGFLAGLCVGLLVRSGRD